MNERKAIERLKAHYPVKEGSKPSEITEIQQRAVMLIGRLLIHAHRRKKRLKGRWV